MDGDRYAPVGDLSSIDYPEGTHTRGRPLSTVFILNQRCWWVEPKAALTRGFVSEMMVEGNVDVKLLLEIILELHGVRAQSTTFEK